MIKRTVCRCSRQEIRASFRPLTTLFRLVAANWESSKWKKDILQRCQWLAHARLWLYTGCRVPLRCNETTSCYSSKQDSRTSTTRTVSRTLRKIQADPKKAWLRARQSSSLESARVSSNLSWTTQSRLTCASHHRLAPQAHCPTIHSNRGYRSVSASSACEASRPCLHRPKVPSRTRREGSYRRASRGDFRRTTRSS